LRADTQERIRKRELLRARRPKSPTQSDGRPSAQRCPTDLQPNSPSSGRHVRRTARPRDAVRPSDFPQIFHIFGKFPGSEIQSNGVPRTGSRTPSRTQGRTPSDGPRADGQSGGRGVSLTAPNGESNAARPTEARTHSWTDARPSDGAKRTCSPGGCPSTRRSDPWDRQSDGRPSTPRGRTVAANVRPRSTGLHVRRAVQRAEPRSTPSASLLGTLSRQRETQNVTVRARFQRLTDWWSYFLRKTVCAGAKSGRFTRGHTAKARPGFYVSNFRPREAAGKQRGRHTQDIHRKTSRAGRSLGREMSTREMSTPKPEARVPNTPFHRPRGA